MQGHGPADAIGGAAVRAAPGSRPVAGRRRTVRVRRRSGARTDVAHQAAAAQDVCRAGDVVGMPEARKTTSRAIASGWTARFHGCSAPARRAPCGSSIAACTMRGPGVWLGLRRHQPGAPAALVQFRGLGKPGKRAAPRRPRGSTPRTGGSVDQPPALPSCVATRGGQRGVPVGSSIERGSWPPGASPAGPFLTRGRAR